MGTATSAASAICRAVIALRLLASTTGIVLARLVRFYALGFGILSVYANERGPRSCAVRRDDDVSIGRDKCRTVAHPDHYWEQSAYAVTLIDFPLANAVPTVPIAVHTVVLDGYEDVSWTRSAVPVVVTNAPPPSSTVPAAHVAVDVA